MPFPKHRRARLMRMLPCVSCYFTAIVLSGPAAAAGPFAAFVISYDPAPGQFGNDSRFNDPTKALGPPQGGGTQDADNGSVVTLGGFGGSITLGLDHTVLDEPLNPFGMDAIVFGNAFWSAPSGSPDPNLHWAECATIEISRDVNGNGQADDPWYLIPGSHFAALAFRNGTYELPVDVFGPPIVTNPSPNPTIEGIYGYAEYSPTLVLGDRDADNVADDLSLTAEEFYTVPDNPFTVGITPGSGGGDAFDMAWAVDPETGLPANLPGFDFIRLTTAVDADSPLFGEKSAEIDAVADVAPDPFGDFDEDGDIDLFDVAALQNCFGTDTTLNPACERLDRQPDGSVNRVDAAAVASRLTGPIQKE